MALLFRKVPLPPLKQDEHGLAFEQLKDIRKSVSIPLILMGYFNPVLQYGVEEFCAKCEEIGIDGLILPDLPLDVYKEEYETVFKNTD